MTGTHQNSSKNNSSRLSRALSLPRRAIVGGSDKEKMPPATPRAATAGPATRTPVPAPTDDGGDSGAGGGGDVVATSSNDSHATAPPDVGTSIDNRASFDIRGSFDYDTTANNAMASSQQANDTDVAHDTKDIKQEKGSKENKPSTRSVWASFLKVST